VHKRGSHGWEGLPSGLRLRAYCCMCIASFVVRSGQGASRAGHSFVGSCDSAAGTATDRTVKGTVAGSLQGIMPGGGAPGLPRQHRPEAIVMLSALRMGTCGNGAGQGPNSTDSVAPRITGMCACPIPSTAFACFN
jgi:hypothetical protein